uniref:Uncharacterized protein n=1 Tax=Rhizophora mucronata TaxID=61149 RepID=A0A2P2P5M5_RHIMU
MRPHAICSHTLVHSPHGFVLKRHLLRREWELKAYQGST